MDLSDLPESFLSSQSRKIFESEFSQSHSNFFRVRVRVMIWSSRVRVESQVAYC